MLWLWYLDLAYPKKIVEPGKLLEIGINGICLWYILEVRARAAYYRQLFGAEPGLVFHSLRALEPAGTDRPLCWKPWAHRALPPRSSFRRPRTRARTKPSSSPARSRL